MELVDEQVHVVARVADQREALLVARHVVAARAEQQLRRVVALVEVRAADRAAAVEALEVEPRRAEVAQPTLLGVRAERRAVGGDVVRDELADERPAGRDGRVVARPPASALGRRRRRRRPRRSCAAAPRRPRTAAGRRTSARSGRRRSARRRRGRARGSGRGRGRALRGWPWPDRRHGELLAVGRAGRRAPRAARPRGSRPGSPRCRTARGGSAPCCVSRSISRYAARGSPSRGWPTEPGLSSQRPSVSSISLPPFASPPASASPFESRSAIGMWLWPTSTSVDGRQLERRAHGRLAEHVLPDRVARARVEELDAVALALRLERLQVLERLAARARRSSSARSSRRRARRSRGRPRRSPRGRGCRAGRGRAARAPRRRSGSAAARSRRCRRGTRSRRRPRSRCRRGPPRTRASCRGCRR